MKNLFFWVLQIMCCGLLMGFTACRESKGNKLERFSPTEEWVYTHVKPGMTKKQVIEAAGEPNRKEKPSERIEAFTYNFGILNPPKGHAYLAGFQVLFQDDSVETIYPVYGDVR